MGIHLGFPSFLWEQVSAASTHWGRLVDVVAEGRQGRFLVVDGSNVFHLKHSENSLDGVFGGQHAAFEAVVLQWVLSLMTAGVELRVVFNGIGTAGKCGRAIERARRSREVMDRIAAGCSAAEFHYPPLPDGIIEVAKRALRRLESVEREKDRPRLRLYFASEEADTLAADLGRQPNAIGILSDDTDFLFHEGCTLLPLRFFEAKAARALDGPTVAKQLQLPLEVYPLLPCIAGCDTIFHNVEVLSELHHRLVQQRYEGGIPPELAFSRAKLLSVLHFLRRRKRAEAVVQALRSLVPGPAGTLFIERLQCLLCSFAAPKRPAEEELEVNHLITAETVEVTEVADSWEELSDIEPQSSDLTSPTSPTSPTSTASVLWSPPLPFLFQFVDLPRPFQLRLVAVHRHNGTGASLLYLLERRQHISTPFLEALTKPSTTASTPLCCADSKLALLRRVLYGMVFKPEVTVLEAVRMPDGIVEFPAVVPLRGPGLPSARELLSWDATDRWQWLMAVLGLQALPLCAMSPAALPLAAFFMMCAHYPIPDRLAEAWLCAALCPREEGSVQPNVHPRLGRVPHQHGPTTSLLQGFTPQEASLPSLHKHFLFLIKIFATALDLSCTDNMYFDSVVYRHILHNSALAPSLPWYAEVQRWLPLRLQAVDHHAGLCAMLPAGVGEAALADLVAQEEAGWARLQEAEAPITGTITEIHRCPRGKQFALVMYRHHPTAAAQQLRLRDSDIPGFAGLVSGTSVTFRLRHGRAVDVALHL